MDLVLEETYRVSFIENDSTGRAQVREDGLFPFCKNMGFNLIRQRIQDSTKLSQWILKKKKKEASSCNYYFFRFLGSFSHFLSFNGILVIFRFWEYFSHIKRF